jgi:hypothetical protein
LQLAFSALALSLPLQAAFAALAAKEFPAVRMLAVKRPTKAALVSFLEFDIFF